MTGPAVPWGFSSDKLSQSPKSFQHSDQDTSEGALCTAILLFCAVFSKFCFVCESVFHVCCLNLDSVVFHSNFCLASFLLFSNVFFFNDFISLTILNNQHDLSYNRRLSRFFSFFQYTFISYRHRLLLFECNSTGHNIRIFKYDFSLQHKVAYYDDDERRAAPQKRHQ